MNSIKTIICLFLKKKEKEEKKDCFALLYSVHKTLIGKKSWKKHAIMIGHSLHFYTKNILSQGQSNLDNLDI